MKKPLLLFALLAGTYFSYAQPTSGMISHWDMNGTTNDVSGGGMNGHGNNLVAAVGIDGVTGHGWYFNGTNSSITIPYLPSMNVTGFTIAAVIKVGGFYSGPCHGNIIFIRGGSTPSHPGSYYLDFSDYPAGFGCTPTIDTNQESFMAMVNAPSGGLAPYPYTPYSHTPHIASNQWYNVVVTFNDTVYKFYINDTLKNSVLVPTPGLPFGTSTDSAAIGFAPYDAPGYPYRFKGIMDDIKMYNRALSPCEVSKLTHWTSTLITANPINDTTPAAGMATFTIGDTGVAGSYQWQVNTGTGFANVSAATPYSGVTTKTLTVNPVTATMNNYQYRCIRTSGSGCIDTSAYGKLVIGTVGLGVLSQHNVSIVPNPANDIISVSAKAAITKLEIIDMTGRTLITETPANAQVTVSIRDLVPGMYLLKLNDNYAGKFVKE